MTFLTVAENLKIGEIASQLSFQRFMEFGYFGVRSRYPIQSSPKLSFHPLPGISFSNLWQMLFCLYLERISRYFSLDERYILILSRKCCNRFFDTCEPICTDDQDIFLHHDFLIRLRRRTNAGTLVSLSNTDSKHFFLPSALIPRMTYAASFRITPLSQADSESHQYTGLDKLPLMADSASLQSVEESCL